MIELITPAESAGLTRYGLSKGASTGRFVLTAGMALDVEKLRRMEAADTVTSEAGICLGNIDKFLRDQGMSSRDIVKITAYVTGHELIDELKAALEAYFAPDTCPVTAFLVVGIAGDCRVELDVIAARS